jgi:hypothetical protein
VNRVTEPPNFNTSPPGERRPSRLRPISTIRPGEFIVIDLRGTMTDRVNAWARVDAIRGEASS